VSNDKLRKLIKRFEGCSLIPYKCPAGRTTIGYGWNVESNPLPPDIDAHLKEHGSITKAMAEELLDIAVSRSIADCRRLYPDFDSYSENRRNALTDMMYNMGYGTLSKFRISNRFVREQKWQEAADNFMHSKWARQVKSRAITVCDLLRYG
jgi:lysozyme